MLKKINTFTTTEEDLQGSPHGYIFMICKSLGHTPGDQLCCVLNNHQTKESLGNTYMTKSRASRQASSSVDSMPTFLHLRHQISICTFQISAHHFLFPYIHYLLCTAHIFPPPHWKNKLLQNLTSSPQDRQSKWHSWFLWPLLHTLLPLEQDFK